MNCRLSARQKKLSFGCSNLEQIEILGDDFDSDICRDFERAELVPIRFSLPRVCKSVAKQLLRKLL